MTRNDILYDLYYKHTPKKRFPGLQLDDLSGKSGYFSGQYYWIGDELVLPPNKYVAPFEFQFAFQLPQRVSNGDLQHLKDGSYVGLGLVFENKSPCAGHPIFFIGMRNQYDVSHVDDQEIRLVTAHYTAKDNDLQGSYDWFQDHTTLCKNVTDYHYWGGWSDSVPDEEDITPNSLHVVKVLFKADGKFDIAWMYDVPKLMHEIDLSDEGTYDVKKTDVTSLGYGSSYNKLGSAEFSGYIMLASYTVTANSSGVVDTSNGVGKNQNCVDFATNIFRLKNV
jgi:hypothetical protein